MPVEIDLCEHYKVEMLKRGYLLRCEKKRKPSIKCHTRREDCPDYHPSIGFTPEEVRKTARG